MTAFDAIDLNLLRVFEALMAEQNVTRAAARLGLTQPAVSIALSRLRSVVGDPLFERSGGRMVPTRRARELIGPLAEALGKVRTAFETPLFRPEESLREFRIVANDYVEAIFLPLLVEYLQKIAPRVRIWTISAGALFDPPIDELQSGEADLAIGFYRHLAPFNTIASKLFDERFVCLLRASQRLPRRKLDLRTFVAIPQIRLIYAAAAETGQMDNLLHARGLERRIGATVAHMVSVPRLVARTGFAGIVPERLARAEAARYKLRVHDVPLPLPPAPCVVLWHERAQFDPAAMWLRSVIEELAQGL
ncbi:MAG TPA: LysR family transcriptional regulator [Thermoanaerobaculia bacterium]|jgi:DNA-binding transcriptional LysR family regulator